MLQNLSSAAVVIGALRYSVLRMASQIYTVARLSGQFDYINTGSSMRNRLNCIEHILVSSNKT